MESTYDVFDNMEPSVIYLAKPGQRLINGIQGIEEETCRLTKNFNNTSLLEFTIDRDINGEINPIYELVQQHYELYVTHHGWFKINEEPVIETDGNIETKQVRAESLEIELQQYDIVDFEVNTATQSSKEMLATDNTFTKNDYLMWHDRVVFYRDTSKMAELAQKFHEYNWNEDYDLRLSLYDYPDILKCWRVDFNYDTLDSDIQDTVDAYYDMGDRIKASSLARQIGKIHKGDINKKDAAMTLASVYPELLRHVHIDVYHYRMKDDETSGTYTVQEILDLEVKRMDELSLLTMLLKEHGWKVGYVDTQLRTDDNGKSYTLAEETGQFQIDTQDIYSFITQDLASYFQCIFFFDTDTYTVNVYRIESIGLDTNIYLSFHNIQNSVSRTSDQQIYTVFNVLGGENLHIDEANFGESWIEDISYFLNTNHFSQEFIDKYNTWLQHREENRNDYMQLSLNRRNANDFAKEIFSRVPLAGADTHQYSTMSNDELVEEYNNYYAIVTGYRDKYVDSAGEYIGDEAFAENYPRDYSDYDMVLNEILPNIETALYNRDVSSAQDTRQYLDNWEFNFDRYGKSYGVDELRSRITTLNNQIDTLKKKGYDEEGDIGDAYAENQHEMYLKYVDSLAQAERAYAERKQEYDDAYAELTRIDGEMNDIKADCKITNPQFNFTEEELWLLDKYRIHTDYTNENIITTSISDNAEWVNTAHKLYKDAKEELSAVSQPQWTFSTTQDNLLLMPEFKQWHGELELGNFIRVAMREDFTVKLRVISIGFNPFLIEPTIDLEFSNMVQYASKRDDFVSLLQNGRSSGKNQISSSLVSTGSGGDINIDSAFLLKLINNGTFASYMGSYATDISGTIVGDVTTTAINALSGNISNIVADSIQSAEINVGHIVGDQADFETLFSTYIGAQQVVTKLLTADDANIGNLSAKMLNVSGGAYIANLVAPYIEAQSISTDTLKAKLAEIDILEAGSVLADSVFTTSLQSIAATTVQMGAVDAYIKNMVAANIAVSDLKAGDITISDNMRIISENGAMVMNGTALQIIGKDENQNEYVGIQLGYDTQSQPSLILRNSSGATVLTPEGITANAVADGLIINNMISKGTIDADRLNFQVMKQGDTVSITQIMDGSGESFGIKYTEMEQKVQHIDSQKMYRVEITSSNGNFFKNGNVSCVLSCHVYSWDDEITDDINASFFKWTKTNNDGTADTAWNTAHYGGTKSVTITSEDVYIRGTFVCTVTLPDGSQVSSQD